MVYIYSYENPGHGTDVIVNNLIAALNRRNIEASLIHSFDGLNKASVIIPYGVSLAERQIKLGFNCDLVLLVDAVTLGYKNKIKYYIKNRYFCRDLLYSVLVLIKDSFGEKKVLEKFKNAMLVSATDIDYLNKKYHVNYLYVPNGVGVIKSVDSKKYDGKITIGIMCGGRIRQNYDETAVFVRRYLTRYLKENPNAECIVAGDGAFNYKFEGLNGIRVIGKVKDLADFYSKIDVFVSPIAKGCGIINRVLECMSYGVFTIGHNGSLTGVSDLMDGYKSYDSYDDFVECMNFYINNPKKVQQYICNAKQYILEKRQWTKIYDEFVIKVLEIFNL